MKKENRHSNFKLSKNSVKATGFKIPMDYFKTIEGEVISKLATEKFTKKHNFAIPHDYFNSLENIVITKLKAESIQKNKTDEIPSNYFNEIENKIINKLESKKRSKVVSLKTITKIIAPIAIAASLLLLVYLNSTSKPFTIDSLSTASIENYFENGQNNIDILSIAALYTVDELNKESFDTNITNAEVENYLSEEDLEEIIYEN